MMLGFSTLQVLNGETLNFSPFWLCVWTPAYALENNYYYYTVKKTREQSYVRDIYYEVSDSDTVVLNH